MRLSSRAYKKTARRALGAVTMASVFLAAAILNAPAKTARGDDKVRSGPEASTPEKAPPQLPVAHARRTLNDVYERLIGLAERVLKEPPSRELMNHIMNTRTVEESSIANHRNAKLTREIAEIAEIEYKEGIFVQDLATVEGEIQHASSDRSRKQDMIEFAKDRLARISASSDKTAVDLDIEYSYSDKVVAAEREASRSVAVLEKAEAKKKLLVEYARPRRLKQLQSEVEKARAEELAKQAESESRKAEVDRLEKTFPRQAPATDVKRILALIQRAIPIEEKVRGKIDQFDRDERNRESILKEIQDLTNELSAIVDEGEALWSAGELAGLKARIQEAARRFAGAAK
jgi:hypothetical protein